MTKSIQNVAELKTSVLVQLYNSKAEKPVTKFADRATAEARVAKLMADQGLELHVEGDEFSLQEIADYSEGAGNEVDPTEDTEAEAETKTVRELSNGEPSDEAKLEEQPDEQPKPLREQIEAAEAKRKAEEQAKKATTKTKGGARGPAPEYADTLVLAITTEGGKNPKREGSASHARFELYRGAKTVGDFLKAGGTRADLRWDAEHGHVKIG